MAQSAARLLHCRNPEGCICIVSIIDIHAQHTLSHEDALTAADQLSCDLAKKFGIDYGWEDEVIHFERPGVHGQILVNQTELRIQAHLGFMLMIGIIVAGTDRPWGWIFPYFIKSFGSRTVCLTCGTRHRRPWA